MNRTDALGRRLRDLEARSARTDRLAAETLAQLQRDGQALADAMASLSEAFAASAEAAG